MFVISQNITATRNFYFNSFINLTFSFNKIICLNSSNAEIRKAYLAQAYFVRNNFIQIERYFKISQEIATNIF